VASDIADAVVTGVRGLGLVDSAAVVRRKTPSLPHGTQPPQIVVTVAEEGDTEHLTAHLNQVTYPVAVTVVTGGGKKLLDDDTLRSWRQQIKAKVDDQQQATFAGVSQVDRVTAGGRAPFDPAALHGDLNYSVLTFAVEAVEAKG